MEINECDLMPSMCKHGQCMNTPGSFECMCNRGYIYDEDSHQCIDDNECLKNPCEGNAQCINLPGSFECKCPEGYKHGKLLSLLTYEWIVQKLIQNVNFWFKT